MVYTGGTIGRLRRKGCIYIPLSSSKGVKLETATRKYAANNFVKSSGLLADVSLLLSAWDESKTVEENFDTAVRQNLFGKASRQRVNEILRIFRRRYLPDDGSYRAFRIFVGSTLPSEVTDRVDYYYTASAEPMLCDSFVNYLYPRYRQGDRTISARHAQDFIREAVVAGKTVGIWESDSTRQRVAQGLLSTLRDLGVLSGAVRSPNKALAPARLHVLAFAYVAFQLKRNEPSGERLINHPRWRLFFLSPREVESYLAEADAHKLMSYQAAGSIVRIEFPVDDITTYAQMLVERSA